MDSSKSIPAKAEKLNLTIDEYQHILEALGREPNDLELEVFSTLWSEHACYKHSIKWLQLLGKEHPNVLTTLGQESAGAIDIGDGLACVFKVESHNHPCAVQPRLGASTGLRVVTRDIISMGAKPLVILSSLRFGDGARDTAKWLFEEVVTGINDFEKGFGIPVVGGEVGFNTGFNSSPIVNNMVVGIAKHDELISGKAEVVGHCIAIIGAPTGKDGIDDDAFAADLLSVLETKSITLENLRDVSVEKELFKVIQLINKKKLIAGLQPIGAQGLVGSACEMAARGKRGMSININLVPTRGKLDGREILFSETWGRVLLAFSKDNIKEIQKIAEQHKLVFEMIGHVTEGDTLTCYQDDTLLATVPVLHVGLGGKAPVYDCQYNEPQHSKAPIHVDELTEPDHYPNVVKKMLKGLNVASKKWLSDKFEKTIQHESETQQFPSDAAYFNIEGTNKALAVTMDCNFNYMKADPYIGAQIAVAEASRNIICAGGQPIGITDCLNFGSPYDKDVFGQFVMSVRGLAKASEAFKVPIVSGNVSFFNQRSEEGKVLPIIATPIVGMVGVVEPKNHHNTLSFKHKGDMIYLIGRSRNDVNGSEYLTMVHHIEPTTAPYYNEDEELQIQNAVKALVKTDYIRSVHDVSNGGLFVTLLESAIPMEYGFDITSDAEVRKDAFLFGESQSRIVVSVAPEKQDLFIDFLIDKRVPFSILGHVTKGEIRVDDESYGFIADLKSVFESTLKQWVEEPIM